MTELTGNRVTLSDELKNVFRALIDADSWENDERAARDIAKAFLYQKYRDGEYVNGVWRDVPAIWQTVTIAGDCLELTPVYDPDAEDETISDVHLSYYRPLTGRAENEKRIRVTGKIGKVLKKFMHPDFLKTVSDSGIEHVVNACKAYVLADKIGTFTEVSGTDIQHWYHEDQYAPDAFIGTLGNSCMKHSYRNHYMEMYAENPRSISMLVYVNGSGELLGRAILWRVSGHTYMDRAYGNDAVQKAFESYANEHGYTCIYASGVSLTVPLQSARFSAYPYMDTVCYLRVDSDNTGSLSTSSYGHPYCLKDTEGSPDLASCTCEHCGAYISDDDGDYCETCRYEHRCANCGDYVSDTFDPAGNVQVCRYCVSSLTCRGCQTIASECEYQTYCDSCLENAILCPSCDELHNDETPGSHDYCQSCYDEKRTCTTCNGALSEPAYNASDDEQTIWNEGIDSCIQCWRYRAMRRYQDGQVAAGQLTMFPGIDARRSWGSYYAELRPLRFLMNSRPLSILPGSQRSDMFCTLENNRRWDSIDRIESFLQ